MNFAFRLSTSVDSALAGRNDELSFFWTSETLLCNEPSGPPTTSHTTTMAAGRIQRRRRTLPSGAAGPSAAARSLARSQTTLRSEFVKAFTS